MMDPTVLLVEDNADDARRLTRIIEEQGFTVTVAGDGAEALALATETRPAAILSDVLMPNMDGFLLCWEIRRDPELQKIPVLLASGSFGVDENHLFALRLGADAYVDKRGDPATLGLQLTDAIHRRASGGANGHGTLDEQAFRLEHGERLLEASVGEAERLKAERDELAAAYRGTLRAMVAAMDLRETGTGRHSLQLAEYAVAIADRLGMAPEDGLADLARAALLCDLGTVAVPDRIFHKTSTLNSRDWAQVRSHPEVTHDLMADEAPLRQAAEVVLAHHERWDGMGYPRGLRGEDIPLAARVLAVADAIDAITSARPYRETRSFTQATEEVLACAGTQFDPVVALAASSITPAEWGILRDRAGLKEPGMSAAAEVVASAGYL